jgi:hypothetical protein
MRHVGLGKDAPGGIRSPAVKAEDQENEKEKEGAEDFQECFHGFSEGGRIEAG